MTRKTVDVLSPMGREQRRVPVLERCDDLVVVDDPFTGNFAVVVEAAGIALTPHRFRTQADAARAARKVAPLADYAAVADVDQRKLLGADPALRDAIVEQVTSTRGCITPAWPDYPIGERTGASYDDGYDAKRRAAQRAGDAGES